MKLSLAFGLTIIWAAYAAVSAFSEGPLEPRDSTLHPAAGPPDAPEPRAPPRANVPRPRWSGPRRARDARHRALANERHPYNTRITANLQAVERRANGRAPMLSHGRPVREILLQVLLDERERHRLLPLWRVPQSTVQRVERIIIRSPNRAWLLSEWDEALEAYVHARPIPGGGADWLAREGQEMARGMRAFVTARPGE